MLLPQDITIAVKLLTIQGKWTFATLGKSLALSPSQVHSGYKRLICSELVTEDLKLPIKRNLIEFLIHGARYMFPPEWGGEATGLPTTHSSPIMSKLIKGSGNIIWPYKGRGMKKGRALAPIYKNIPEVALYDENFYAVFSLLDSLRAGGAREREVAQKALSSLILEL